VKRGVGRGGFSVVEPLVALLLLGIGLTGTIATLLLAARTHSGARVEEEAVARAAEIADSVRLAGGGSGELDGRGWRLRWEVPRDGWGRVEVMVGGEGGPMVVLSILEPRVSPPYGAAEDAAPGGEP
jgi:type II secretory pathway pseudopilin PulG